MVDRLLSIATYQRNAMDYDDPLSTKKWAMVEKLMLYQDQFQKKQHSVDEYQDTNTVGRDHRFSWSKSNFTVVDDVQRIGGVVGEL